MRSGDGSAGQVEGVLHLVDAEGVGEVGPEQPGVLVGEFARPSSIRRRSSVTPDFSVRLLRNITRMLIGYISSSATPK